MEGWISLHRKFLDWEWFDDNNMVKLFIYLLLKANHKDGTWKGIEIKRGQLLTGLDKLNSDTKISIQSIRTCLKRLEKTGEINMQITNKYRLITLCNYDSYQKAQLDTNNQPNNPPTSNQQPGNKLPTPNNNDNKEDNEKGIGEDPGQAKPAPIPYKKVVDYYNSQCKSLTQVKLISANRKKVIGARWNIQGKIAIYDVINKVANNTFFHGSNDRNWKATFDWIMKESNFIKIIEGNYDKLNEKKKSSYVDK